MLLVLQTHDLCILLSLLSPPGRARCRIPAIVPSLSPRLAHALRARSHHAQAEELERFFRNLDSRGSGYISQKAWCAAVMRVCARVRVCVGDLVQGLLLSRCHELATDDIRTYSHRFPALTLSSSSTCATVGGSRCLALIACSA